jgi:hypothetical protein
VCVFSQVGWAPGVGWLAGSTAAEGARRGCDVMSVMDDESVVFAATSVHVLSPFSPPLCSCLAVGGVPCCCSRGLKVRAVCVLEEVRVCARGHGLLVLFLGKLPDVLARR